jgi:DivIVA domain-containing protein
MTLLYVLLGALVVGAVAFGVAVLITGADPGLAPAEPDGSAVPLPTDRPLSERDFVALRFDTGLRGYRMGQVDTALRRAAYDIGYKEELVAVLEAEVTALRSGNLDEANALQRARLAALGSERAADEGTAAGLDAEDADAAEDAERVVSLDKRDADVDDDEDEPAVLDATPVGNRPSDES